MCFNITTIRDCGHRETHEYECDDKENGTCSSMENIEVPVHFACLMCQPSPYAREVVPEEAQRLFDIFQPLILNFSGLTYGSALLSTADLTWLQSARLDAERACKNAVQSLRFQDFWVGAGPQGTAPSALQESYLRIQLLEFLNGGMVESAFRSQAQYRLLTQQAARQEHLIPLVSQVLPEETSQTDALSCPVCGDTENLVRLACPSGHIFCRGCVVGWVKDKTVASCPLCRESFNREEFLFPDGVCIQEEHLPTPFWLLVLQGHETLEEEE